MIQLKESKSLSKGIFWMICGEDIQDCSLISIPMCCDRSGVPDREQSIEMNSKDGTSLTHKNTWSLVVQKNRFLRGYSWNYFPRGRVEIVNNVARVFLNSNILRWDNAKTEIIKGFYLYDIDTRFIVDNSSHYSSFLD
jgi:hypothetical protein